jgi:hypothetical protein
MYLTPIFHKDKKHQNSNEASKAYLGIFCIQLYSRQNTSILIPTQKRIFPTHRLRLLHKCPSAQKIFMREHPRQLPCDGAVHEFHDCEIGREEDVEIALMYLFFLLVDSQCRKEKEWHRTRKRTKGVVTGTVLLLYLVCTTGALTPLIVSGKSWKSLVSNR